MKENRSPWIHQLLQKRKSYSINKDTQTDIAIIGAGIAGVATAFYILKHTSKKVVICEAGKLAHGATGHNAGQVTSYFERPFASIVEEYGLEMASRGQRGIEEAWALLDEMYTDASLDIPFSRFKGHAGLSTREQFLNHCENNYLRKQAKLPLEELVVSEHAPWIRDIPSHYESVWSPVPAEEIHMRLETFDPQYHAVVSAQKGVINSALFCEGIIEYLEATYPERFTLYEHTPIKKVVLKNEGLHILDAVKATVSAERVVLCTNGFEKFSLIAPSGLEVDTRFHHHVNGVVAFMSGFLEPLKDSPIAISYYTEEQQGITDNPGDPYFYMTRRPYEYERNSLHNLICVGGPDISLEDRGAYHRNEFETPESAQERIDGFIHKTYDKPEDLSYQFMWHGLMGYTTSLLRMIGKDPEYSTLHYNLGCNGVGILPSLYGAHRVMREIRGDELAPSIFDVKSRNS